MAETTLGGAISFSDLVEAHGGRLAPNFTAHLIGSAERTVDFDTADSADAFAADAERLGCQIVFAGVSWGSPTGYRVRVWTV